VVDRNGDDRAWEPLVSASLAGQEGVDDEAVDGREESTVQEGLVWVDARGEVVPCCVCGVEAEATEAALLPVRAWGQRSSRAKVVVSSRRRS